MAEVPVRGVVYWMDLGFGAKPWLVVSNNPRNRALDTVLAARITATMKTMPTRADLSTDDGLAGQVLCDDLEQVFSDRLGERVTALTPATMARVGIGLRYALAF